MLWRVIEAEVVPASEELGIGQIVWSPIAQGVLTGKYKKGAAVPEGSRATDKGGGADFVNGWLRDEVLEAVENLEPIARDMNLTMSQLAIAWVLSNPNVSAAIVGASRPEQITENAKAAGLKLPQDVLSAIDTTLGDVVKTDSALTVSPAQRL